MPTKMQHLRAKTHTSHELPLLSPQADPSSRPLKQTYLASQGTGTGQVLCGCGRDTHAQLLASNSETVVQQVQLFVNVEQGDGLRLGT